MLSKQRGFTLIELIVVIVVLSILAIAALPKFIDLRTDAAEAATKGVAGVISSASAINYAARTANSARGVALNANNVCTSAIISTLLHTGLPAGYSIGGALDCSANGSGYVGTCNVTGPLGVVVPATVICVKP